MYVVKRVAVKRRKVARITMLIAVKVIRRITSRRNPRRRRRRVVIRIRIRRYM